LKLVPVLNGTYRGPCGSMS